MKILIRTLKYFAVLLVLLGIFSLLLPSVSSVSRSVDIQAPPEKVYAYINGMKQFNRWSPWFGLDPDAVIDYSGPETGTGSAMTWSSEDPSVGKGRMEIVSAIENSMVETRLEFDGQGDASAQWLLESVNGGTRISWLFTTEWGYNPIGRYMGLMMDKWVGGAYEEGLAKLKSLAESD